MIKIFYISNLNKVGAIFQFSAVFQFSAIFWFSEFFILVTFLTFLEEFSNQKLFEHSKWFNIFLKNCHKPDTVLNLCILLIFLHCDIFSALLISDLLKICHNTKLTHQKKTPKEKFNFLISLIKTYTVQHNREI